MSLPYLTYLEAEVTTLRKENRRLQESLLLERKESQRLFHRIQPSFRFAYLPAELRRLIWGFSFPGPQVLRVTERCALDDDVEMLFCSARPPALLHACRESRHIALAHYEPFFMKGNDWTIPRPIYFRPKIDVLFLDFFEPDGLGDFVLRHPEANKIESIAIREEPLPYPIWFRKEKNEPQYFFLGMKRLLLVEKEEGLRPPSNRCCSSVKLLPCAKPEIEITWTKYIAQEKDSGHRVPNIEKVEAMVAMFFYTYRYLESKD